MKKIIGSSGISAEDLVQETFIKIWENKHLLKDDILFDKQLFTISKNIAINALKKEKRIFKNNKEFFNEQKDTIDANDEDITKKEAKESKLELIYTKINELPEKRKRVFELYKFEEKSYDEISLQLNISINTVANHLRKAMQYLRTSCNKINL